MFMVCFESVEIMKKRFLIAALILVLVLLASLAGCSRAGSALNGSGKIISQEIDVTDFNSLNARGAFVLKVNQADSYKVSLSIDDNLTSRVKFTLDHKTLKLNIEAPATFFPTALTVTIAMPEIVGLNLSDGAVASLSGFQSPEDFSLFLSGNSSVSGSIEAGSVSMYLSGSSTAILSGGGMDLDLTSLEASKLDLSKFSLMRAKVRLDQESEALLNVTGQFDVDLNGKSKLYFVGNPIFTNTSISGDSIMSLIQQ